MAIVVVLTGAMIYAGTTTCASTVHCDMHVMQSTCIM